MTKINENLIAQNRFTGGMVQDLRESLSNGEDYYMARNAINSTRDAKDFGLTNEGSNKLVAGTGSDVVGVRYCEERNWTFVFKLGDSIWIYNHGNGDYKEVMNAGEFGCTWGFNSCEWMGEQVEFKSMDPCNELHVYFSVGCEYYKVNVHQMLDPARKAGLMAELACDTKCGYRNNCEYFKIFKQGCAGKIAVRSYNIGGKAQGNQLKAGAYVFAYRYLHTDGGETNVLQFSDRAFVGSEHNRAGEDTASYIEVSLSGLDCKFAKIELFVIEEVGGIITAKVLNNFHYNNGRFSYRYNGNDGTEVDIREILGKEHVYLMGKYLQQKDGHMLYYGIKSRKNPHLQPLVNGIITEWLIYEMPIDHAKKYNIRGHMGGETYAYCYIPNYIDGSHGPGFHIPAVGGGGSVPDQISSVSENYADQLNDNASLSSSGGFSLGSPRTQTPPTESDVTFNLKCQYINEIFSTVDLMYEASKSELTLNLKGDTTKSDIIECIRRDITSGEYSFIYIVGENGDRISFVGKEIKSYDRGNSITLGGSGNREGSGEANRTSSLQIENPSNQDLKFQSRANSTRNMASAADGGGQSPGKAENAEITEPQEVERTRGHIEDKVNDPQNDHYDDIIQAMVNSMETDAKQHMCSDILLWQEHLKAHCCWCKPDRIVCANTPAQEFTPTYGPTPPGTSWGHNDWSAQGTNYSEFTGDIDFTYYTNAYCGAPCNNHALLGNDLGNAFPNSNVNYTIVTVPQGDSRVGSLDYSAQSSAGSVDGNFPTLAWVYEDAIGIIEGQLLGIQPEPGQQPEEGEGLGPLGEDCTICCGSGDPCPGGAAYERCIADVDDPDNAFANWEDLIDWYNQDYLEPEYRSSAIHEGAKRIAQSIQDRERWEKKKRKYDISKSASYSGGGGLEQNQASDLSGHLFDNDGRNETEVDIKVVASGRTEPDFEQDILYPCTTDCKGEFIYRGLAGTPVAHHKFPDSSEQIHYVSKSQGVPYGTYWSDAGESNDLYVRVKGVRFSNLPSIEEVERLSPLPICRKNPFTIGVVKLTDTNKKISLKGLATGTFRITNNGKDWDQPRYGTNSMEEVSYYHDDGEGNRLSNQGSGDSHTLYSLDGRCMYPALRADTVKEEVRMKGEGERYGLYLKGKEPDNSLTGRRYDALGARQSIFLHEPQGGGGESALSFKQYVDGGESSSPGGEGVTPLENRSGQPCIWFGSGLEQLTDESFTGDVLEYNVPINLALGQYVSFRNDLPNQYGNLENLNYIPLLQGNSTTITSIQGPVGDTYIGLYSFVKTGFVSDKVGECSPDCRFDIPAQVPTKEEKRCICDGPEDVIHHMNGAWVWPTLPEEGDAADPKNWIGTQSEGCSPCGGCTHTRTYAEAVGQASISDFYLPGTTTTNISFVTESRTNPWLREKGDLLSDQWYPEIKKPDFRFDGGIAVDNEVTGWEDCYTSQYHREWQQVSLWQRIVKAFVRTSLNIIFPMMGLDRLFDVDNGGIDFTGNLVEFPMLVLLWYLMLQVLFRNDMLDKLLGIPVCKSDEVGGFKEVYNKGLFFNPSGYNEDYSTLSDFYTYEGVPDPYHTCDCSDCDDKTGETSDEIYISDHQVQGSIFDAYTHVKPSSKIHIPASYGKLTNLFVVGGDLYAHTTDAMIPLRRGRAMVASDYGDILMGAQGFLLDPEGAISEGIPEGYAGLQRHNEHKDSQYGYFFVDSEADIPYVFTHSKKLVALTKGMYNFFKEKLNFCNGSECIDQRSDIYYSLGVDPRYNRFLLTKSDGNYSFTMSWDLNGDKWISFHDYIPRAYIADRRDMYTLDSSGIWKHNEDCTFQTFYGTYYPYMVEFTALNPKVDGFVLDNIIVNTEAEVCSGCSWVLDLDQTFTKMAFWNSTQGTGLLPIEWISDDKGAYENAKKLITDINKIKANKKRRLWRINELKDHRKNDCRAEPMTICDACQPIHEINNIFDCAPLNKQDFRGKVIVDKYAKFRFIYDHDPKVQLNLIYVNTYGKESQI